MPRETLTRNAVLQRPVSAAAASRRAHYSAAGYRQLPTLAFDIGMTAISLNHTFGLPREDVTSPPISYGLGQASGLV